MSRSFLGDVFALVFELSISYFFLLASAITAIQLPFKKAE
jgi:hypothetical protein